MASLFYKVQVVNQGIERIRISRHDQVLFEGSLPSGASFHLRVGDSVLIRRNNRWLRKFAIVVWKDRVSLRFGKGAGKNEHQVFLDSTPHVPGKTRRGKPLSKSLLKRLAIIKEMKENRIGGSNASYT